jgi:hypothetical protein
VSFTFTTSVAAPKPLADFEALEVPVAVSLPAGGTETVRVTVPERYAARES